MNLNLVKINAIVLLLIIEINGGVIEGVYGRIKNTTTGLTQDVKNVWSYSKGLVGLGDTAAGEQKEDERGLIGGMLHSAHEKMHTLHEQLWAVEEIPNDSGLLWNMYCRLKQRLAKAKNFVLGNGDKPAEGSIQPPNPEEIVIKNAMDKIFNEDGTRKVDEDSFNKAVEDLRKVLNAMREGSGGNTVYHGEGLIDVRMTGVTDIPDLQGNADVASVGNDIYDKVNDSVNTANDGVRKNVNDGMNSMKNNYNKALVGASDAAAKEKDILDTTYNRLSEEAKNVAESVNKSAVDTAKLAYS